MANTVIVKAVNMHLVRQSLKKMKNGTILALSQETGLSVVTVTSLLKDMLEQGEVYEGESIPSKGGRPSAQYLYNPDWRHALVVYGCQKNDNNLMHSRVINLFGECIDAHDVFMPDVQVDSFVSLIDGELEKYPRIGTIGFGLPGVEEGGIITGHDYPSIVGDKFMDFYKQRYGLPVRFVNDVNAAAKGFFRAQQRQDDQCAVAVYFPRIYPPGAGIIINGKIYTGTHHFAGEIGYLPGSIDWRKLNYANVEDVVQAVGQLLCVFCCVISPRQFVLYGDFFTPESAALIRGYTQKTLVHPYDVSVTVGDAFERDLECGMIDVTLEQLNRTFDKKGI